MDIKWKVPFLFAAVFFLSVSITFAQKLEKVTVLQSSVSIGDPHIVSDSLNRLSIVFSVYEALVKQDNEGNYQPSLAESWDVGEETLPHLLDAIRNDYDHEMMDEAIRAIGRPALAPLLEMLDDPTVEWYVPGKAASLLGEIADPSSVAGLKRVLARGEGGPISPAAASLAAINEPSVKDALLDALNSKSPMVRGIVAYKLRSIVDEAVVEALIPLLNDGRLVWDNPQYKKVRVAEMAVETLEIIGGDRAVKALEMWRGGTDS